MTKLISRIGPCLISLLLVSACKQFVVFPVHVDSENNPLVIKKMPKTSADLFEPPKVSETLPNPDATGAFKDWAHCLVLFKEGHPHGNGKLHGNAVLERSPWRQEQITLIHNTPDGIKVDVDRQSTVSYVERIQGKEGPQYFRLVGGGSKLWGLVLRFYDKQGQLLNDEILKQSDQYQIFFSISDLDSQGQPYDVLDVRYRGKDDKGAPLPTPVPSPYFSDKANFDSRQKATTQIMEYVYRDTWTEDDMNDGVRDLFNIKLLPPLNKKDLFKAYAPYDQDCVGLKGHLRFNNEEGDVDPQDWPLLLSNGRGYRRRSNLLPHFYLAIRVMKCAPGKKAIIDPQSLSSEDFKISALSKRICAPYYAPNPESGWQEIIRFNIPIRVFSSTYDSDPTQPDAYEPYYYHIAQELGLTPEEAYEIANNTNPHDSRGLFREWFL